jgi:hypothetical protein
MRSHIILALAIVIFAVAQFLPALSPDMGAWNHPESKDFPGYIVTLVAWPYYLSNILLIFGPLLLFLFKRFHKSRRYYISLMAIYLLTPLSSIAFMQHIYHTSIGFHLWITTFCIAAIGILLEIIKNHKAKKPCMATRGNATIRFRT